MVLLMTTNDVLATEQFNNTDNDGDTDILAMFLKEVPPISIGGQNLFDAIFFYHYY